MGSKRFKKVSQSVERFDDYLFRTRGADSDTARNHRLRNDNHHDAREGDRRSAGIDYQKAHRGHPLPELLRNTSGRSSVSDMPEYRGNDRRSVGPDCRSAENLHPLSELARSHNGRGSVLDARVPSPRISPQDVSDDEDEDYDDDSDSDSSGGALGSANYKHHGLQKHPCERASIFIHLNCCSHEDEREEGQTL